MQTVPHDLGFILCPSTPCGLTSCTRNSPHFHCRFCTYGTSQIANAIAHGRLCNGLPQKDYQLSAEAMYQSTQPFSYYPPVTQQSSGPSKIITTQQSTMLSFVLPSQNQFSGLYGPQTVFPNPNLFSPSGFSNYGQMDTSWVSQGRMMPSTAASEGSNSNQSNCCPLGVISPDKHTNKEMLSQNWSTSTSLPQKFLDPSASCSISLLFLEHNKDSDECIDVDDICLTPKAKDTPDCLELEPKSDEKEQYLELTKSKTYLSKTEACLGQLTPKRVDCLSSVSPKPDDQQPQSTTSNETDIIVEESDTDSENDAAIKGCTVCETKSSVCTFTPISVNNPVTSLSGTPVYQKLVQILGEKCLEQSYICPRCMELINAIDTLEMKLCVSMDEIRDIYKVGKTRQNEIDLSESMVCKICDKSFSSLTFFEKHQQNHTDSIKYCCEFCGRGFACEFKLKNHIKCHEKDCDSLRFQCEICGKQFSDKTYLSNHINRHKTQSHYQCIKCFKKFKRKVIFQNHLKTHNDGMFVCQHCGLKTKYASNFRAHVKICSNSCDFLCEKCDRKFPSKSSLTKHVEMTHKLNFKFECEQCHKGFWKESDLKRHLITHRSDKPFNCKTCGNSYKEKKTLNHHMKIHDTEQSCRYCGKKFTRSDALADHINSHTGRQPYECTKCGKKFSNRINFNCHLKRHNSITGSKCLICKEIIADDMSKHMKEHREKKNFQCHICPTVFSYKNSLMKHLKRKHSIFMTGQFGDINSVVDKSSAIFL